MKLLGALLIIGLATLNAGAQAQAEAKAPAEMLRSGTPAEKLIALRIVVEGNSLHVLDDILPIIRGEVPGNREEAAKAYIDLPRNLMTRFYQRFRSLPEDELTQALDKEIKWYFDSPHYPLGCTDRYLLKVIDAENDPLKRQVLIRELTTDEEPTSDEDAWQIDETHPGSCGNGDHSDELALTRMVEKEWRYALQLLRTPGPRNRYALFHALAGLKNPEIRSTYIALLRDRSASIRYQAVSSLCEEPDAELLLRPMLTDPYAVVRQHVAYAVSERDTPEARRMLLQLAFDPIKGVREAAARPLAKGEDQYIEWLFLEEARGKDRARSRYATEFLTSFESKNARAEIIRIAKQKGHPGRDIAIESCVYNSAPDKEGLMKSALADTDEDVLIEAMRGVYNLKLKSLAPELQRLMKSKNKKVAEEADYTYKELFEPGKDS